MVARSAAEKVIFSCLKGEELMDHINTLEEKPMGAAWLALILAAQRVIDPSAGVNLILALRRHSNHCL